MSNFSKGYSLFLQHSPLNTKYRPYTVPQSKKSNFSKDYPLFLQHSPLNTKDRLYTVSQSSQGSSSCHTPISSGEPFGVTFFLNPAWTSGISHSICVAVQVNTDFLWHFAAEISADRMTLVGVTNLFI